MHALTVEGLAVNFGGIQALKNVSFMLAVGEKVAMIGSNGAGKTTLFNVINGQIQASRGKVYLEDVDISRLPTHRCAHLGQSRSFQISSLFLQLTVLENCLLALHGVSSSRYHMVRTMSSYQDLIQKSQKYLEQVDLLGEQYTRVKNLSYGEQRRLEIAMTLVTEPKLLLLDEPSAGLTMSESVKLMEIINSLGKQITVLMVAHDLDLVYGVAERIIVLHSGEIIADGPPEQIRANTKVNAIYLGIGEGRTEC